MENYYLSFILCCLLVSFEFKVGLVEGIVGGRLANPGEFQYVVSIQINGHHICSGSVIGNKHVLAAAHCVIDTNNRFKNSEFSVRAGIIDSKQSSAVSVIVETIYVPKEYFRSIINLCIGFNNEMADISVLKVRQQFESSQISKLNLPKPIDQNYRLYHEVTASFMGFGVNVNSIVIGRDGENMKKCGKHCGKLIVVETNTIGAQNCINQYRLFGYKHICANVVQTNRKPSGACHGDAGGPLVFERNTVIGVLAQNTWNCNESTRASIYTRVSSYISFIKKALRDEDNQLGDEIFDDVRVADWMCRSGACSMIQRT